VLVSSAWSGKPLQTGITDTKKTAAENIENASCQSQSKQLSVPSPSNLLLSELHRRYIIPEQGELEAWKGGEMAGNQE
jgi:hypothetical protein